MPTTEMCAACAHRRCDRTAVIFMQRPPPPDFAESRAVSLGHFCEPAAWRQVFHALRTRGPEYIGGEVRRP